MKIFGTIYPFVESNTLDLKYGRQVANFDFFKFLLSQSSFDEYHIFCLNVSHFNLTKNRLLQFPLDTEKKKKIYLFLYNHLIDKLRSTEYYIFHLGGWGYFFPGFVYLRNKYAKNKFPITGLIHSLNGIETKYHALKICTAPLLPYDAIICSSIAGEKVLKKTFIDIMTSEAFSSQSISFAGTYKVIPLGFDPIFLQSTDRKKCRQQLSLPQNATIFLTLNRFSPQTKADIYPLLKTFKRLRAENKEQNPILVMAGAGTDNQIKLIRQMIKEMDIVNCTRMITNFETHLKPSIYGAADVYVSLSDNLQETFGLSVIEAMASGLPTVVSDINGYSELVNHSVTGFKIPTRWLDQINLAELAEIIDFNTMQLILAQCMVVDLEILYSTLQTLLKDPHLRRKIGDKSKEKARDNYNWEVIIKKCEEFWADLYQQSQLNQLKDDTIHTPLIDNPFRNNYLEAFKHYPTTIINDTNLCCLTKDGIEVQRNRIIPLPYLDVTSILQSENIITIIDCLKTKKRKVADIISLNSLSIDQDIIKYTLLWMAKYGLIQILDG